MERNFLDRLISYWNPKAGARRSAARMRDALIAEELRKFNAASKGRRSKGWTATGASANTELATAGPTLRNRSRSLVRNNSYAAKALKGIAANVVGTGIRPSFSHPDKEIAEKAKMLWKKWVKKKNCDFHGRQSFFSQQFLVMLATGMSGDVFIRKIRTRRNNGIPLQIQLLEIDFLDTAKDGMQLDDGGYIHYGIEYGPDGRRRAYWMFEQHPGENRVWKRIESFRIPADDILHCYFMERPGQEMGTPMGVSAFMRMRDFDQYEDAQLIRQKIAACFAAFVEQSEDAAPGEDNPSGGPPLEKLEPGIIEYLHPGRKVSFATPPPIEGYGEYSRNMKMGIAAGYDVTYEMMTSDLSNVNFSSARMGWIEFNRMVNQWQQQVVIEGMCEGVMDWFIEAAYMAGELPLELDVEWTAPRREMIDPWKETKGYSEMARNGFMSYPEIIRQMGSDPEKVVEEMEWAKEKFDEIGLKPTSDPRYDPNRTDDSEETKDDMRAMDDRE